MFEICYLCYVICIDYDVVLALPVRVVSYGCPSGSPPIYVCVA